MKTTKSDKNEAVILGLMSGTSLDGLDLALCGFSKTGSRFGYRIFKSRTIPYSAIWKQRLASAGQAGAEKYFAIDALYAKYVAEQVEKFLKNAEVQPLAIASHGHTIFHQPKAGFSTQMGNGAAIAALTGITTVCDFRSLDVALGGQGAPLVPIGDQLLFGNYQACLNIGGIANISFHKGEKRMAGDICVANMLLNYLAGGFNAEYDKGGAFARKGTVNKQLLQKLNGLDYYKKSGARSIGREWFEHNIRPLFEASRLNLHDQLATATTHVATIIAAELKKQKIKTLLVTGGGAYNTFLIEQIAANCDTRIKLPDAEIINFKEALIFAFLGYLRLNNKINTLASVTGAGRDSVGGAVYEGNTKY